MPTECNPGLFDFGSVEGRRVVAGFDGGRVTSAAGALLLGATDRAIGLIDRFAGCFSDGRSAKDVEHAVATLVGQRVFGIALGYEDLIDHDQLRHDPMLATLAGKLAARRPRCAPLAGKSTLNRLEHGTEGLDGLRAHLRTAPARPRPYPVRPGHLRHDSPAAAENRCLGPHQHPPHQGGDGLSLPPSARIRPRPRPPQQHWPITTRRYRPTYSRSVPLDGGGALLMPAPQLNTAPPTFLPPQPRSKRPKNRTATYPREKCGLASTKRPRPVACPV